MKISVNQLRDMVKSQVQEKLVQDGCSGQVWHNDKGEWSSPEDATSWSRLDPECEEDGQYKVIGGKKTKSNSPCGRQNRSKLCKEEDEDIEQLYQSEKIEMIIRQTIKQELAKMRQGKGGCTYQQILNAMDQIDRARSGKLYSKKK